MEKQVAKNSQNNFRDRKGMTAGHPLTETDFLQRYSD